MTRAWRFLDAAVVPVAITPAVITALPHAEALPFLRKYTMTATPPSILDLLKSMQIYFQGEKIEALVFILPLGILAVVFSIWLLTDSPSQFTRGLFVPLFLMGLIMSTVGGVVGYRTPSQMNQLERGLQSDPKTTLAAESARMEKVNSAWNRYLLLWGLFGAAGLALRFATQKDFAQGMGIALVLFSGVGLMIDGFAERRAQAYTAVLSSAIAAHTAGLR